MNGPRGLIRGALLTLLAGASQAADPTMRAAVVEHGALVFRSVPVPSPGADEVRIRVRAAGVNPIDWKMAEGYNPAVPSKDALAAPVATGAFTPGFDVAGTVDAVGPGVTGWKKGDAVLGLLGKPGAYAQYAIAPASSLARKPGALRFVQAAGLPTAASAAWSVVVDSAAVQPGQRVLVQGGAGGVGSAAVQIAKSRGAFVIATALGRHHAYLRRIGVDETIDYETERFEDRVRDVDVVINTVNADIATRSIGVVKRGGLIVSVSGSADRQTCEAAGVRCTFRARGGTPLATVLDEVGKLATAKRYDVHVDALFPLERANEAWQRSRANQTLGKLILTVP